MRQAALSLVTLLALSGASPVVAAGNPPFAFAGPYLYTSLPGIPHGECTERWTFGAGGVETIESGQEITHYRYRVEARKSDGWLDLEQIDSNHLPDCYGATPLNPRLRLYFYLNAIGGFVLCEPPTQYHGQKMVSHCWAHVEPQR